MDISSMLEVQVNEVKEADSKENVTPKELLPGTTNVSIPISQEESNYYKLMLGNDISSIRFQRLHCTACDIHIGSAPANAHNMFEHPVLRTLLCAKCREFYGDGTFEQGDDATDMFCRWCANGGNLYCCSFCSNTFCYKCIKRNFDPILRKKIEADERWKCFVCDPRDLYNARGTCWALLKHIQTMNRIFQNNSKLSQEEIDDRMNTDESKCCLRRRKRKRRKNGSNSEEDDETYMPKQIVSNPVSKRKKKGRGKVGFSNDSNDKYEVSDDISMDNSEIFPPLLSCEQTMVECENATVSGDGTIVSQLQVNPNHHKENPSITQQPTMYNTAVVNVSNFLQPAAPLRHVTSSSINQTNQANLYQTLHSVPTPMVSIPNHNVNIIHRPRFSLLEPQMPRTNMNIIEIESDTEDVAVVGSSQVSRLINSSNGKAVPVALVSSKNSYNTQERHNVKTLNQRLLPHGKEINNILNNLKIKFQDLYDTTKRDEFKNYKSTDAHLLIKQFHCDIRNTVTQLACINDRIIREYNRWKRYQIKIGAILSVDKNNTRKRENHVEIPLDMTCINESDAESEEIGEEIENSIMSSSELIGETNVVDGINFFKKKHSIDRAVGDRSVLMVNKSVQINTVKLQNYDKHIRHSVLKSSKQSEKKDDASVLPVKKVNKQLGNFEDHFIQFVQKLNMKKQLPDPNETPLKDLIEANSPFISEMLETMDKSSNSASSSNVSSISVKKDSDLKSYEPSSGHSITCKTVDNLVKMVSNTNNDLNKKTAANEFINNKLKEETKMQRRHFSTTGNVGIGNISKNKEKDLSKTNVMESESSDDCTIIDD
ncbi:transcriptional regulator ATRX-like [Frieseomelitta varia]|uniref:transcriptional regulator ATRX-like n=1 Tax=Frieseomelitta varia TaxID=561572 RepID=UPI001CB68DA1|nr:transcriptional regulator ATRX-like [Frieseomelitta varia]